jgi:hypothetical protein
MPCAALVAGWVLATCHHLQQSGLAIIQERCVAACSAKGDRHVVPRQRRAWSAYAPSDLKRNGILRSCAF